MNQPYVIWSNEHRAWWGPNRWGYTPHLREAGLYPRGEALMIARTAGIARQPFTNPNEIALPFDDALEQAL